MSELAKRRCIPCEEGGEPMAPEAAQKMMGELAEGWMLIYDAHLLVKEFHFKDFADAMAFANKVAAIADEENHHPELQVGWGHVSIELTTHAVEGLTENDFIVASKVDQIKL